MCIEGGDAAVATAKKLDATEEDVDIAAFAAAILDHQHDVLALLRLNVERFPKSPNTWNSNSWMQFANGDRSGAKASFQKKLQLARDDLIAKRMLSVL